MSVIPQLLHVHTLRSYTLFCFHEQQEGTCSCQWSSQIVTIRVANCSPPEFSSSDTCRECASVLNSHPMPCTCAGHMCMHAHISANGSTTSLAWPHPSLKEEGSGAIPVHAFVLLECNYCPRASVLWWRLQSQLSRTSSCIYNESCTCVACVAVCSCTVARRLNINNFWGKRTTRVQVWHQTLPPLVKGVATQD